MASYLRCGWSGLRCAIAKKGPRQIPARRVYRKNKMYRFRVLIVMAMALPPAGLVRGQVAQVAQADFLAQNTATRRSDEDRSYARGESAIDARRWEMAVEAFGEVAA